MIMGFVRGVVHRGFEGDGAIDRRLAHKLQKAKGQYPRQKADQHAAREKGSDHAIDVLLKGLLLQGLLLQKLRRERRRNSKFHTGDQRPLEGGLSLVAGETKEVSSVVQKFVHIHPLDQRRGALFGPDEVDRDDKQQPPENRPGEHLSNRDRDGSGRRCKC
jgi:hypothetical protein